MPLNRWLVPSLIAAGCVNLIVLLAQAPVWYVPIPGVRTFLVTDSRATIPEIFATAPTSLGTPLGVKAFGVYTVYIYGHHISENLG